MARADNADIHALAAGSVATTDNANGSSTNPRGSIFSDVRPGLLVTYNAPRLIQEFTGEVDFFYYFGRTKPNVTFRGDWKAYVLTGPRTEMSLGASASMGQLNALASSTPSAETPLLVQPEGRTDTKNASASEAGSWVATEFTSLSQRGFARITTTEDTDPMIAVTTKSFEVGGGIGIDHRLRRDNFSFEAGASYVYLEKRDPFLKQMGDRLDKQINPRVVGVWAHDWSKQWSSIADVGLVYVNPIFNLTGDTKSALFPIYGVTVAYTDVFGRAQFAARRQVVPNLFVAQNSISESLNATWAMPLTFLDKDQRRRAPKFVGVGTVGVDRTQMIDPIDANLIGNFLVARLDIAVGWQYKPGQTFGFRYEFAYQNGDQIADMIVPSYYRNTFYATFALRWPEDVAVRVPRRNNSMRADKKDLAPIGAEPVIVDPAELLEEGQGDR